MKKIKKERGITLVALIITIVVLLILAMVAIGAVQDSNIIAHAQNAAGSFNQAKANEIGALTKYEEEIQKYTQTTNVTYADFGKASYEKIGENPTEISEHIWIACISDSDLGMYYSILYGDFYGFESSEQGEDAVRYYMIAYDGDLSGTGYPGEANKWYSATSSSNIDFSTALTLPEEIATNKSGKAFNGYEDLCALFDKAVEAEAMQIK